MNIENFKNYKYSYYNENSWQNIKTKHKDYKGERSSKAKQENKKMK